MLETYVSNFMEGVASEMETRKNFGNYIREKRKTAGLSQKELAQQLFVSESSQFGQKVLGKMIFGYKIQIG